jgi:hypothetical protein
MRGLSHIERWLRHKRCEPTAGRPQPSPLAPVTTQGGSPKRGRIGRMSPVCNQRSTLGSLERANCSACEPHKGTLLTLSWLGHPGARHGSRRTNSPSGRGRSRCRSRSHSSPKRFSSTSLAMCSMRQSHDAGSASPARAASPVRCRLTDGLLLVWSALPPRLACHPSGHAGKCRSRPPTRAPEAP